MQASLEKFLEGYNAGYVLVCLLHLLVIRTHNDSFNNLCSWFILEDVLY